MGARATSRRRCADDRGARRSGGVRLEAQAATDDSEPPKPRQHAAGLGVAFARLGAIYNLSSNMGCGRTLLCRTSFSLCSHLSSELLRDTPPSPGSSTCPRPARFCTALGAACFYEFIVCARVRFYEAIARSTNLFWKNSRDLWKANGPGDHGAVQVYSNMAPPGKLFRNSLRLAALAQTWLSYRPRCLPRLAASPFPHQTGSTN